MTINDIHELVVQAIISLSHEDYDDCMQTLQHLERETNEEEHE